MNQTPAVKSQQTYPEIRGVWITNNDTTRFMDHRKLEESVDLLAQFNLNTLLSRCVEFGLCPLRK
ncbi:MAG: family 10 glycosylhydrolase [Snowella sp.]